MDRNSVIGSVLIGLIFVLWYFGMQIFYPTEPKPIQHNTPITTTSSAPKENQPAIAPVPNVDVPSIYTVKAEEKIITIKTDRFSAKLSTKGATLVSFILKEHTDFDNKPFDLITDKKGSLSLFYSSQSGQIISTKELYFKTPFHQDIITLNAADSVVIPFEFKLNEDGSKKIILTYVFRNGTYVVDVRTSFVGDVSQILSGSSYQFVWNGELGFSERDRSNETTYAYSNTLLGDALLKVDASDADKVAKEEPDGVTHWITVQSKYFISAIIPTSPSAGAYIKGEQEKVNLVINNKPVEHLKHYTAAVKETFSSQDTRINRSYSIYIGPQDYNEIKSLGVHLERAMDFGFEWLTRPFAEYLIIPFLGMLEKIISNYGLILIIFALMIKLVTYPLSISQMKSMRKMTEIQPKIKKLQEQYKKDPMKLQQEMSRIYREAGVSPIGGCLPLLLQFPILIALYNVFRSSIQLRHKEFLWVNDLSSPDVIFTLPFSIPFYGDAVTLIPLLMAVSTYFQMKLTPTTTASNDPAAQTQQKIFAYLFPVMMLFIFNSTPAGLSLYYLMFNVFSIAQQVIMNNFMGTKTNELSLSTQSSGKSKK